MKWIAGIALLLSGAVLGSVGLVLAPPVARWASLALATFATGFGALVALGYRPAEATRLLKAVGPGTHSTEELIRRALQGAARESNP